MKNCYFRHLLALVATSLLFLAVAQDDDPVVIQMGDQTETLSEFNERFEVALRGVASQQGVELDDALREQLNVYRPQFLEQRATELALLAEAESRGLSATEEEVNAEIENLQASLPEGETLETAIADAGFADEAELRAYLTEQLTVQKVVEQLREETTVTQEEIAAAYEERAEEFTQPEQVCASHILLETEEAAQEVLTELEGGADFATLAQERSTGPSGPQGGDLGCFGQEQMVAPFAEAAFAAEVGTPVGPVQTEFGYHVILVNEKQEAGQAPLDEVTPQLEQQLTQEKFVAEIDALREASGIEVFPEAVQAAALPEAAETGGMSETGGMETGGMETGGMETGGMETGGAATEETGGMEETGGAMDDASDTDTGGAETGGAELEDETGGTGGG